MVGDILFRINRIVCTCGTDMIFPGSFWVSQSPGSNMAMIFDFLHIVGNLFRVKELLSIVSSHL